MQSRQLSKNLGNRAEGKYDIYHLQNSRWEGGKVIMYYSTTVEELTKALLKHSYRAFRIMESVV